MKFLENGSRPQPPTSPKHLRASDVYRVSEWRYKNCKMSEYVLFKYILTLYTTLPWAGRSAWAPVTCIGCQNADIRNIGCPNICTLNMFWHYMHFKYILALYTTFPWAGRSAWAPVTCIGCQNEDIRNIGCPNIYELSQVAGAQALQPAHTSAST